MARKWIKLLASCSLIVAILIPAVTIQPVDGISIETRIQTMGHGYGGG